MQMNNHRLCYWCGKLASSEDHVPAKAFFKKQKKSDELITVPSCSKHNQLFSKDEEWLRNILTAITHDSDALEIWKKRSFPSLRRNRGLLKEMRQNMVRLKDGRNALKFSKSKTRHVVQKIVRGLYYKTYKQPLGKAYFRYYFNPEVNLLKELAPKAKFCSIQNGVFQWAVAATENDPGNAIWWLEFHRSNLFVVTVTRQPI